MGWYIYRFGLGLLEDTILFLWMTNFLSPFFLFSLSSSHNNLLMFLSMMVILGLTYTSCFHAVGTKSDSRELSQDHPLIYRRTCSGLVLLVNFLPSLLIEDILASAARKPNRSLKMNISVK